MEIVYIGMGGNIPGPTGPPAATLAAAAMRLSSLGRVVCRSSLYSTEPVGFVDQPRFVNAVVALETELSPRALLEGLLSIELEFGRDRSAGIHNGPRTLDLDILLFGDRVIDEPGLQVPHPRMRERAFVLVPLNEIATSDEDASRRRSVKQYLESLRCEVSPETDAIVPHQSDAWRAGPCRDASLRADAAANEVDPDR